MWAIFGLGNPGGNYQKTYHNLGYMVLDALANKYGVTFSKKKCMAQFAEVNIAGQKVMLFKPETFMNNSGYTVAQAVKKFKLNIKNILVVYDDKDIPVGATRLRQNGSAGGHNGMKSIIADLGRQDFARLRIGFGADYKGQLMNYVLSNIAPEHKQSLDAAILEAVRLIEELIKCEGEVGRVH